MKQPKQLLLPPLLLGFSKVEMLMVLTKPVFPLYVVDNLKESYYIL